MTFNAPQDNNPRSVDDAMPEQPRTITFHDAVESQLDSNGILILNSAAGSNLTGKSVSLINKTCPLYGIKGLVAKSTEESTHEFMKAVSLIDSDRLKETCFVLVDDTYEDRFIRKGAIEVIFKRLNLGTPTVLEYEDISDPNTAANIVNEVVSLGFKAERILALVDVMMPINLNRVLEERTSGNAPKDLRDKAYAKRMERTGAHMIIELRGQIGKAMQKSQNGQSEG